MDGGGSALSSHYFLQGGQVLLNCLGWVPEAGSVLPHRHADPIGIQVQLIHQK